MKTINVGSIVTVKGNDYGYFKVMEFLPVGSYNRRCKLVKVLHSSTLDFNFGLIKIFRLIDLRLNTNAYCNCSDIHLSVPGGIETAKCCLLW